MRSPFIRVAAAALAALWSSSLNCQPAIGADEPKPGFSDPNEALKPLEQVKPNPAMLKKYGLNQQGPLLSPQAIEKHPHAPLNTVISGNLDVNLGSASVDTTGFRTIQLTVTNRTDRPIVLDGSSAVAIVGGARLNCAPMSKIEPKIPAPDNPAHKYLKDVRSSISAFATVGGLQTLEDKLNDMQEVRKHYGFDEARREELESRFGRRILFPGESTTGTLFLKTKQNLKNATVELPICSLGDKNDSASISVSGSTFTVVPQSGPAVKGPGSDSQNKAQSSNETVKPQDATGLLKGTATEVTPQPNLERITPLTESR